jgi:hypothetical protein
VKQKTQQISLSSFLLENHSMLTSETLQKNLQTVVLLCSSSRGGSSITTEFLRQRDDILHLPAEINPLLRIHQISRDDGDWLDATDCTSKKSALLWKELSEEIGTYNTKKLSNRDWNHFTTSLHKRISWQWPNLSIPLGDIESSVQHTRNRVNTYHQWDDIFLDKVLFHCFFLKRLQSIYPQIDPRWYDLSEDSIQTHFGKNLGPLRQPTTIIEEPPFVLISPFKVPTPSELQSKPLIIKTPSNAYRLPFFKRFFENQRLKILHLKRDAQSSINGLLDGWRYERGFHAHFLEGFELKDEPQIPTGTWKYDLPPHFSDFLSGTLPEICAFQWNTAHRSILENRHIADDYLSLWFQDIVEHKDSTIKTLWDWLKVSRVLVEPISPIRGMPLVMATCAPRERRWFEKKIIIEEMTQAPKILQTMEDLKNS